MAPAAPAVSSTISARQARSSSPAPARSATCGCPAIRGQSVCASLKGIPFEPCFNLDKQDDRSFRGSVSGMGFAYCDFHHQGGQQMLMARAAARPRTLHPRTRSADATPTEVSRVETPQVGSAKLEPVKAEPAKVESAPELRRSTD
jgi:hypothetical protein